MKPLPIGQIITDEQGRDAIHIAVAPVVAKHQLFPGQHVGPCLDGAFGTAPDAPNSQFTLIGIVDPFLGRCVMPGERFWLFMYPNTITSLAHVWTHPAFAAVADATKSESESEKWLRNFAATIDIGYRDLMGGAAEWIANGEYLIRGGLLEGVAFPDEFWPHYEAVTGKKVEDDKRHSFFSCSC